MSQDTLTITDNRTGREYEISVNNGSIRALDLRQIKVSEEDFGLMTYDPGFANTASCRSRITYIDGEKGILRYRGYPIEQLAERRTFLEVAYLVFHGELPDPAELEAWTALIRNNARPQESVERVIEGCRQDGPAMALLMSSVAALSAVYPDAGDLDSRERRRNHLLRLIAQIPAISAYVYRRKMGLGLVRPNSELSYTEDFLRMVFETEGPSLEIPPVYARALDILFILHADHEQNCSANAMRSVGSSRPDPYMAAAAAVAALAGPLHGGANEAVVRMLERIGSKDRVPHHIERVKRGELRLMGFGHRVYKNYDPRAKIIREKAREVFEVTESNPLLDVARELERIALDDEYFVSRRLYPNVDFYSGLIYQAMGFPTWMFPVLFALARMSGWVSQWEEMISDAEQRIARPRQLYEGDALRDLP